MDGLSVAVFGERPNAVPLAGAGLIVLAVLALAQPRREWRLRRTAPPRSSPIGTMLGTTVLAEGEGPRRVVASAAILAGVVALAVG